MDERRLNTGDVMDLGITSLPAPKTDIPTDRDDVGVDAQGMASGDELTVSDLDGMKAVLERGAVLHCSEYYGIPNVWKADDGSYRGTLLQYRAVTEDPTFSSVDEAIAWFVETAYACVG